LSHLGGAFGILKRIGALRRRTFLGLGTLAQGLFNPRLHPLRGFLEMLEQLRKFSQATGHVVGREWFSGLSLTGSFFDHGLQSRGVGQWKNELSTRRADGR
jgi:hypothetical protein